MALPNDFNLVNCGAGGVYGTGLAGCRIDRKRVVALGLLQKGTVIPAGAFDRDVFDDLILSGKLIYLKGVVSFTDNTPEDNIDTAEGRHIELAGISRTAFYERARAAYAVIATGEQRVYGCILIKKGVVLS